MQQSFIDLRQNDGRLVDDSFWPSFTDIMTVIVMIFLIATTVLIVKNWELVKELQQRILSEKEISSTLKNTILEKNKTHQELLASMAAKEQISRELDASIEALQQTNTIAEQNQAENITLEEQIANTKSRLELIRLQLLQTKKKLSQSKDNINNKNQTIEDKIKKITELDLQLEKSLLHIENKTQTIQNHIIVLNRLADLLDKSRSRTAEVQQNLDHSKADINQLNKQLLTVNKTSTDQQQQISKDKDIIKNRDVKYNKLLERLLAIELQLKDNKLLFDQAQNTITAKQQIITKKDNLITEKDLQIKKLDLLSQTQISDLNNQALLYQQQIQRLSELTIENVDKQKQLEELSQQIILAQDVQQNQHEKFEQLQEKYKKLIRPSRSALGKYVVEVRYEKINSREIILYKDTKDSKFTEISISQLNKNLNQLKQQYGLRLYVKVIIPDNSGLSYKEAWNFMQDIFQKYDYYYQL